mmetsp:Transcript_52228/g.124526  ORF Transcript_52228/g.124526 Transcript_52228/m.124526 type:complete len:239 (-) Transcript_52228:331-1047(-)
MANRRPRAASPLRLPAGGTSAEWLAVAAESHLEGPRSHTRHLVADLPRLFDCAHDRPRHIHRPNYSNLGSSPCGGTSPRALRERSVSLPHWQSSPTSTGRQHRVHLPQPWHRSLQGCARNAADVTHTAPTANCPCHQTQDQRRYLHCHVPQQVLLLMARAATSDVAHCHRLPRTVPHRLPQRREEGPHPAVPLRWRQKLQSLPEIQQLCVALRHDLALGQSRASMRHQSARCFETMPR